MEGGNFNFDRRIFHSFQRKMPPKRGPGRPRKVKFNEESMCGQDTESVSEADLIKDPKTYSRLPETLIAGREKRAIKKSIKLETAEYYEWADYHHQGVYRYIMVSLIQPFHLTQGMEISTG